MTTDNPAHAGETISVFADDFFNSVWPPPPIGLPVPADTVFQFDANLDNFYFAWNYLYLQDYPTPNFRGYSITDTPAVQITFRGLAPGRIGVEQIDFVVPANQAPGDWALFFNIGSCPNTGGLCDSGAFSSPYAKIPVR